jgi:hypothetical protein
LNDKYGVGDREVPAFAGMTNMMLEIGRFQLSLE